MNLLSLARTERHILTQWWWTVDRRLLACALALMGLGVVLVMAASPPVALRIGTDYLHFVVRHIAVLVPALAMMLGLSLLSGPRMVWRVATFVLAGSLLAMILVLFIGTEIKGGQRWISLPGFSLQPSEFAKPAFAVFIAWLIARQKEDITFPGYILAGGVFFFLLTLLMLQPDFGMSVVVTSIFTAEIFLAGLPFRYLVGIVLVALVGLVAVYYTFDHVHSRIDRFLDPASGDNYQIARSIEAFQNGGLTGTGPGQGTVKLRLPDAHADFIFSVGAEEFGFLPVLVIIGLYAGIVWRGMQNLTNTSDLFVILACGGLLTMFGLQALIHMGSAMHLLPTKGMTLPFISYGGSSLLATAFGFGLILALTRRSRRSSVADMGLAGSTPARGTTWP